MPTYDYICGDCAIRFEDRQSIADRKHSPCPSCSTGVGKQVISPVRIDYLKMGTDPYGNPTAARKWAKMHEKKGAPLRTTGKHRPD